MSLSLDLADFLMRLFVLIFELIPPFCSFQTVLFFTGVLDTLSEDSFSHHRKSSFEHSKLERAIPLLFAATTSIEIFSAFCKYGAIRSRLRVM
jgi:hypothetical protein